MTVIGSTSFDQSQFLKDNPKTKAKVEVESGKVVKDAETSNRTSTLVTARIAPTTAATNAPTAKMIADLQPKNLPQYLLPGHDTPGHDTGFAIERDKLSSKSLGKSDAMEFATGEKPICGVWNDNGQRKTQREDRTRVYVAKVKPNTLQERPGINCRICSGGFQPPPRFVAARSHHYDNYSLAAPYSRIAFPFAYTWMRLASVLARSCSAFPRASSIAASVIWIASLNLPDSACAAASVSK